MTCSFMPVLRGFRIQLIVDDIVAVIQSLSDLKITFLPIAWSLSLQGLSEQDSSC